MQVDRDRGLREGGSEQPSLHGVTGRRGGGPRPLEQVEGADLHCEVKANGLRAQVFFDWLDTALGITQG